MESENVTFRKLHKSSSLGNLYHNNSALLDATMMSVPNTSLNDSDTFMNLNDTIKKLTAELHSAHLEIENLNSENFRLKMDLGNCQKTIDAYKKVTLSNRKITTPGRFRNSSQNNSFSTPARSKDSPLIAPFNNSHLTLLEKSDTSITMEVSTIIDKRTAMDVTTLPNACTTTLSKNTISDDLLVPTTSPKPCTTALSIQSLSDDLFISTTSPKSGERTESIDIPNDGACNEHFIHKTQHLVSPNNYFMRLQEDITNINERKHRVMIFADQTGYGVRQLLQYYLGDSFFVTSIIKPHATVDEILKSCVTMCADYTNSDFVLILAGSNDRNPMLVQTYLHYTLRQLKSTNVLVGKIYNNIFLNSNALNNLVKLVCNNCENSMFVSLDLNNYDRQPKYVNKLQACRLIHREILHKNYKINYQNYITKMADDENQSRVKYFRNASTQTDDSILTQSTFVNSASQTEDVSHQTRQSDFFRE